MGAQVGSHDDDSILEVYYPALAIGEPAIIQNLQEHVEHIPMCLLNLIQQDDAVRAAAHCLGQLAALIVAHIARRRTNQPCHRVLLHVLAHVNADHAALIIKESLCQRLGQLSLAHAGRPQEDKGANRPLRCLDTGTGPENSLADHLDSLILANYPLMEHIFKMQKLFPFAGEHLGHRNASPAADHPGNVFLANLLLQKLVIRRLGGNGGFLRLQLFLQLRQPAVFQLRQLVQVIVPFRALHLAAYRIHFLLDAPDTEDCLLLSLPLLLQLLLLLLQCFLFPVNLRQLLLPGCIIFLLQGLLLNLQLENLAAHLIQWPRHGFNLRAELGCRLIHQVNGLVRQETVGNITVRQHSCRYQGRIPDADAMVHLVTLLQSTENGNGILHGRLPYHDRLEAAL